MFISLRWMTFWLIMMSTQAIISSLGCVMKPFLDNIFFLFYVTIFSIEDLLHLHNRFMTKDSLKLRTLSSSQKLLQTQGWGSG